MNAAIHTWWRASRAYSVTAVLAPCIAIGLLGRNAGTPLHLVSALCAALGVSLLLFGVNMANDIGDDARGIDTPGGPGGSGVLQAGLLSVAQLRSAATALIGLGLLLGLPSVLAAPRQMLPLGVVTLLGAALYSHPALGLKYHALGDAAVFVLCGPLLAYGASVAGFARTLPGAVALGAVFGFAAVAILHVNNLQDIAVDRRHGAITIANVIGERASRWYLAALYLAAAAAWVSLQLGPVPTLIGALGFIPAAQLVYRTFAAHDFAEPQFAILRVQAAQAHLVIGASTCVALFAHLHLGVGS